MVTWASQIYNHYWVLNPLERKGERYTRAMQVYLHYSSLCNPCGRMRKRGTHNKSKFPVIIYFALPTSPNERRTRTDMRKLFKFITITLFVLTRGNERRKDILKPCKFIVITYFALSNSPYRKENRYMQIRQGYRHQSVFLMSPKRGKKRKSRRRQ